MGSQATQSLPAGRLQQQGRRAQDGALDRESRVWVLSALCQTFRIPFDERLVTGQLTPPCDFETVARAAGLLGLRAGWKALPASRLKKLTAPFVVALVPVISEPPPQSPGAHRENLPSLEPEASDRRLAFVLRIEEGRVAFFEQGASRHTILPLAEFESRYAGSALQATPKNKPLADPDAKAAVGTHFSYFYRGKVLKVLLQEYLINEPDITFRCTCFCANAQEGIDEKELATIPRVYIHLKGEVMSIIFRIASAILVAAALNGCSTSVVHQEYDKNIKDLGYEPLYPPQEGWQPGLIFQLAKTSDNRFVKKIICQTLLVGVNPVQKDTALPSTTAKTEKDMNFAIGLAQFAIADISKAEVNLKNSTVRDVTISYGDARTEYLVEADLFTKDGAKIPVVGSCLAALDRLKTVTPQPTLLIVSSALLVKNLKLDVGFNDKIGVSTDIEIQKMLDLKPGTSTTNSGKSNLGLPADLYIGLNPLKLEEYIRLSELGPEAATIKTRALSQSERADLANSH